MYASSPAVSLQQQQHPPPLPTAVQATVEIQAQHNMVAAPGPTNQQFVQASDIVTHTGTHTFSLENIYFFFN